MTAKSCTKIKRSAGRPYTVVSDQALMAFIKGYVNAKGFGPSIRDVMDGVGFRSTSAAQMRIIHLREKGLLVPAPKGTSRTIFPVLQAA